MNALYDNTAMLIPPHFVHPLQSQVKTYTSSKDFLQMMHASV
uniref:Uncharacterized protein n=1 Tax=Arundo donax TaxID=35708 RepID=A0A0A8Z0H0_ARUDO